MPGATAHALSGLSVNAVVCVCGCASSVCGWSRSPTAFALPCCLYRSTSRSVETMQAHHENTEQSVPNR